MARLSLNMRNCQVLLLFLVLWDGRTESQRVYTAAEGENITIDCLFKPHFGSKKTFCKNDCKKDDILVWTLGNRGRDGRYSIESVRGMYVSIRSVTRSDAGRYRCTLQCFLCKPRYKTFWINITKDATTLKPIITLSPDDISSSFTVKTTAAPVTPEHSSPSVTTNGTSFSQETFLKPVVLFMSLTVAAILILLSVALLLLCWKKRNNKPPGRPVNTEHSEIPNYENSGPAPASTQEDFLYQSLSPASRDHNDIYCIIRPQPQL